MDLPLPNFAESGDNQPTKFWAKALFAYKASADDPTEISFDKYELLAILDDSAKWWSARKMDGTTGIAPSNYLTKRSSTSLTTSPEVSATTPQTWSPLAFSGGENEDCRTFIHWVKKYAFQAGKQRDDLWVADYAATLLVGDALQWFATELDEDTSESWKELQKALILKYRPSRSQAPTPPAAAAPSAMPSSPVQMWFGIPLPDLAGTKFWARALHPYTASEDSPDELSFFKHEPLRILDDSEEWWTAMKLDGTTGWRDALVGTGLQESRILRTLRDILRELPVKPVAATRTQLRGFRATREPSYKSLQDELELESIPEFDGDDATGAGHVLLRLQREYLEVFRKIEEEVPQLMAFRQPFVPPPSENYIVHRTLWYGGEGHPVERKAAIVVPVSRLPLTESWALHKFKLIAGPRWTTECPKDAGFSRDEIRELGKQGWVKISCEDMPERAMNLKWCSDVLDRMVKESTDPAKDKFQDVPVDTRHIRSRERKQRLGKHHARRADRPTLRDFPKEWLPPTPEVPPAASQASSVAS
ncbi:hypothetical protein FRB99_003988 [Tulasnella sp. 403]|nr:hypothetical protein FRB99_003988 [Tulasnella sp. 403]